MNAFRTIYRYWVTLIWLAVIAQIAGAAYGAFYSADKLTSQSGPDDQRLINEKVFDHGFAFHTSLGYLIFLASVLLFLLALAARLGKRRVLLTLAVPLAVTLQVVLAWISEGVHGVGVLHGLNALVIFGLTGYLTREAWQTDRAPEAAAAATSPAA